jgi:hypothetical protein
MCAEPKCRRASVLLMQDCEASDAVASIDTNTTITATRMGRSVLLKYALLNEIESPVQFSLTSRRNLETDYRSWTVRHGMSAC